MPRIWIWMLIAAAPVCAQRIDPPEVPGSLQVPPGHEVSLSGLAVGAQIYTCQSAGHWVLKAPDAKLFDGYGNILATHFAGPTWLGREGSRVVAATRVAATDAKNPKSIPWLLLKATANDGSGVFGEVTYVQRVYTAGGVAPPDGACAATNAGADTRVDYTAMYYFWKQSAK